MGVNINRPIILSDPMCKRKRKPQINIIGTNDQDPQPMTRIKGDAIAAPVLPSKFLTGKSEAERGPGSVGEYVKIISEKSAAQAIITTPKNSVIRRSNAL